MEAIDILLVGLGGGLGSLMRWKIGQMFDAGIAARFKAGTILINITGTFLIAYISAFLAVGWQQRFGDFISAFVLTGVLGGYTTFSTMQLDAVQMAAAHRWRASVSYLVISVAAGLLAAAAGVALARW